MDIGKLKDEINNDPLVRGYAGMTDMEVLADGYDKYRSRNKTSLTGSEILNAVDKVKMFALSDADRRMMWDIIHIAGGINPFGIEADLFIDIFGDGSVTITTLAALRVESISRWEELGLGNVKLGHIERVRV